MIASGPAMARLASVCYLTGGLVGFLTAWLVPAWSDRTAALIVSTVALLAGVATALFGARLSVRVFYVLVFLTLGLLAVQMSMQRGHAEAVAAALLLPLVSMFVHAFYDNRSCLVVDAAVLVLLVVAGVAWHALPVAIVGTLVCVNAVVAAVTGWLVQTAAEAETDLRTGLPNRRGLNRVLRSALAADPDGGPLTLALLDVGTLGAAADEGALRALAESWRAVAAPPTVLARYGDTSFAVLVRGGAPVVTDLLERLRAVSGGCPAGTAHRERGDDLAALVDRAEGALSEARRAGGAATVHHDDTSGLAATFEAALAAGEFSVAYQPIVAAAGGHVTGAEALVRWSSPACGPVAPDDFIPDAERCGFIRTLDRWVLRTACRTAASWPTGVPSKITVNVSGRELDQPGYYDDVVAALAESGLAAGRLVLEVTESTLDADAAAALDVLRRLRTLGIRIAIDDFGTGYSSLSRLHRLPADVLKIDRSFVAELGAEEQEAPIVAAIIALARTLGLRTVAEGVEDRHQAELLRRFGCDEFQGWLYGRAGEPERIAAALDRGAGYPVLVGDR
ncbi:putative bifunctional diguanylate cyclase/phosphodiesterase [Cryptosporangium arvum]|uniref:putative bifunctional diguanylate cyclase/phosphodiesterase n=1 Tax=Cryptosporangium arvum TaxID=80871 RepID=UPI0004B3F181|nr:GGDEF domain-containing phosphodiesterase [Cryptosporangium arvum]